MGPVVNMAQRKSVEEGIRKLSAQARIAYSPEPFALVDADAAKGAFVPPTLLKTNNGADGELVHELEIFGPVATVVPYRDKADAFAVARRGGGSLAASVFSGDTAFLAEAAVALGTTHGRPVCWSILRLATATRDTASFCRHLCMADQVVPAVERNSADCMGCGSITSGLQCKGRRQRCPRLPAKAADPSAE